MSEREKITTSLKHSTLPLEGERGGGPHPLHQFLFCPKCGSQCFVEHNAKSKHCEACGFTYYFNPSAATVALIEREVPASEDERGNGKSVEWLCVRRAKEPARGTLDLPGGFSDMFETSEEGVAREVLEETGLTVVSTEFLFSLPNQYLYSDFLVHTIDMFFRCRVADSTCARAADDAAELLWLRPEDINPHDFGLKSIRAGIIKLISSAKNS